MQGGVVAASTCVLPCLAGRARARGDLQVARELTEQAMQLAIELGEERNMAGRLQDLAILAWATGETQQAARLQHDSLALLVRLGDRRGIATALDGVAALAAVRGKPALAARLFGAASALLEAIGAAPESWGWPQAREVLVAELRDGLGLAAFAQAWASGCRLPLEDILAEALRPLG
jgi:non-specific serine/threonine protein kinase